MNIRKLTKMDKEQILYLDKNIFGSMDGGWGSDDFDYYFNDESCFVSYEEGHPDKINGYIFAGQKTGCTNINNIGVKKEFEGQGIGKELMKKVMLKELEQSSTRSFSAQLHVLSENLRALNLYRRLGFQEISRKGDWVQMEATAFPELFRDASLTVDKQPQPEKSTLSNEEIASMMTKAIEKLFTDNKFITFFAAAQKQFETGQKEQLYYDVQKRF